MKNTTLCYISDRENSRTLMLHRIKKKNDENSGKWIGIGGKFEEGESPEECLVREVKEECGIVLTEHKFRGIVTFVSDEWGTEYMHLFTAKADADTNKLPECDEGVLQWVKNEDIFSLELWEGDKIFLKLLFESDKTFSLKLTYKGDKLIESKLN